MNKAILSIFLVCLCFGCGFGNIGRGRRVSSPRIIFRNDEPEPLLPKPTFAPFAHPIWGLPPSKKFSPAPTKIRPIKSTPYPSAPPRERSTTPSSPEPKPTKPTTLIPTAVIKASKNSTSILVDPILDGSYYVPFKKNETHASRARVI